jgi:hypothetical protein
MLNNLFQKNTKKTEHRSLKIGYLEMLASSLVVYSAIDVHFADEFKRMIKASKVKRVRGKTKKISRLSLILAPPDTLCAYQRAEWLIKLLEKEKTRKNEPALSLLFDFVNDDPAIVPKNLIVGVAATSIPGITLGKIRRRVMNIILNSDFLKNCTKLELAKKVTSASTGVLSPTLKKAKFSQKMLEPDIAEWIFGDRYVSFFAADEKELKKIKNDLIRSEILHSSTYSKGRPAVIALSPAANSEYVKNAWDLELLRDDGSFRTK